MIKSRLLPVLGSVLLSAAVTLSFTGCDKHGNPEVPTVHTKLTAANIAKIQKGMNRTQVENLLGPPATSDTQNDVVFKKTRATYTEGKDSVEIIYKNEEVEEIHSTVDTGGGNGTTTSTTTTTTKQD